jgi:hypothetical protein
MVAVVEACDAWTKPKMSVSHATIPLLDSGRRGLSTRVLRGASRLRGWVVVRGEVRRTAETHRSAVARYVSRD